MRPDRLSDAARTLIADPDSRDELLLSAISPWEFCKLIEKGRLGIIGDLETWIGRALEMPGLRLVPLSPGIALKSTTLPGEFHNDPADQIIVATARGENATIVTSDRLILDYPGVRSVW